MRRPSSSSAPPAPQRRARIVEVAIDLFTRYGVRRTSIDDVARQAGIAKGSVYLEVESKDALFRAACQEVADQLVAGAEAAAADAQRPLADVVTDVLMAKFWRLYELVHARPHAAELLQARDAHAGETFRAADARIRAIVVEVLERAAVGRASRVDAATVADLLLVLAHGNSYGAAGLGERGYRARLRLGVELVLAGAAA